MGLFDRLFGGTVKGEKTKIRAQFKSEPYFKKELDYFNTSIAEIIQEGDLDAFRHWSVAVKILKTIALKFSSGSPVSELSEDYSLALDHYIKGWDEGQSSYADLLEIISLCILFERSDADFDQLAAYVERTDRNEKIKFWKPDALLWFLLNARVKGTADKGEEILFPGPYRPLYKVTGLSKEKAASAMQTYLGKWYDLHKKDPWYNNHLKDRGYSGYWAWEVAAVVKVMGIDDSSFKDHPHYPYDAAHWQE